MDFENYRSQLSEEQKKLLLSVESNHLEEVKNLAQRFWDANKGDQLFNYILVVTALKEQSRFIAEFLIESGCSVKISEKTHFYCTPLYYAVSLGDSHIFKLLWKKGASLFDLDFNRVSALELAMILYRSDIIEFVLNDSKCLEPNCENDIDLFYAACWTKNSTAIGKFLSHNFSLKTCSNFNADRWKGFTPLHFALCAHEKFKDGTIANLLDHEDIDLLVPDNCGRTPVHSIFRDSPTYCLGNGLILEYMIRAVKRHPIDFEDKYRLSLFMISCSLTLHDHDIIKHTDLIKYFIENKIDVNRSVSLEDEQYPGLTALHFAARSSSLNVLKLLLEHGADATKLDKYGEGPLHLVCRNPEMKTEQRLEMIELLLQYGADPNAENGQGRTPLHELFRTNNKYGKVQPLTEMERVMLTKNSQNINHTDRLGLSYLHMACMGDDLEIVENLIKNGASINSCIHSKSLRYPGYSALHLAVELNRVDFVELLLAHGADVNLVDCEGNSPLHFACDHFRAEKLDPSHELYGTSDDVDWLPSRANHIRIIELLIQYGAKLDVLNSKRWTPLLRNFDNPYFSYIALDGHKLNTTVKFLESIEHELFIRQTNVIDIFLLLGANINARCIGGCCPDSPCKCEGPVLHLLLRDYRKPLLNKKLLEYALKRGADTNVVDCKGSTPLHEAVNSSMYSDFDELLIDLLMEHGANMNMKSKDLKTPLHVVVSRHAGNQEDDSIFVKLLSYLNVDLNAQDNNKKTPLHIAIDRRNHFRISKLLEAGADINMEDEDGNPPTYTLLEYCSRFPELESEEDEEVLVRIIVTLIVRVKKMSRLKIHSSEEVASDCKMLHRQLEDSDLKLIDLQIEQEMNYLRSQKIDSYTSLYDILFKGCNAMAKHALNVDFQKLVSDVKSSEKYFYFGDIIKRQYEVGLKRSKLLSPAKKVLSHVTKMNWPDSCSEKILSYLCDKNLEEFIKLISDRQTCKRLKSSMDLEESLAKIPRCDH